ncbi:MAG TPA: hypothetical protein VL049_24665 [Candidatus Dormibacteraeota bacterium]|nr:hypothetical protein [Candidatus Dormibacteraeota bacterium]
MKRSCLFLLVAWLMLAARPSLAGTPVADECCVCINCTGGERCVSVVSSTVCSGAVCDSIGCPNSQVMPSTSMCSDIPECPAAAGPAAAPALSPVAAGVALLGLVALARRALKR